MPKVINSLGSTKVTSAAGTNLDSLGDVVITSVSTDEVLTFDGTNWVNQAGGGGTWSLITTTTASSDATVDFTGLSSTYIQYRVVFEHVVPATDGVDFEVIFGTGGTPTYQTGANYQVLTSRISTGAVTTEGEADATEFHLNEPGSFQNLGSGTNETASGEFVIINPSASEFTHAFSRMTYLNSGAAPLFVHGGHLWEDATAVTAVRFQMSSGNIASGSFRLYGLSAS